jgi:zinc protease
MHIIKTIALLCLLAGCATAGTPESRRAPVAQADTVTDPFTVPLTDSALLGLFADDELRTGRLPNGLAYYVRSNPSPRRRAELRLVVRAGSVLEEADQRGLAHVLEHMAFNGTARFSRGEIVSYLERLGMRAGADLNAYTGFDETVYRLTLPTDTAGALEFGLRVMEDWASSIAMDSAHVARERGVVVEEWRAARGAGTRIFEREHAFLWAGSPYADRVVIGGVDAIQGFDLRSLQRFYHRWYRPDLMAVVAVGDFDADSVEQMIREGFGGLAAAPADAPSRPNLAFPAADAPRILVTADPELAQSVVQVCWMRPATPRLTLADREEEVAVRAFVSMLTRRLEQAARQPGSPLVAARADLDRPLHPVRRLCITALAPEGASEQAVAAVLAETERVARGGFTEAEWARDLVERSGRSLRESGYGVDSHTAADAYVAGFVAGEVPVLPYQQAEFDLEVLSDRVEQADAEAQARAWLQAPSRVVLVNVPGRAGTPVPTEARLARLADSVAAAEPAPYTDLASAGDLMPRAPEPGRIVAEDSLPEIHAIRWTLSNGARVVVHSGGGDQVVYLRATSPGGLSVVPDSLFVDAVLSPLVVESGGLGELSAADLERRVEGTLLEMEPFVGPADEGLSGSAEPGGLEELLQLAHLHFVAPRLDTTAWNVVMRRVQASLRGQGANPTRAFADTLGALIVMGDPRETPLLSPENVERVDPARALAVFRARFADASDFTFYLGGRVWPERARPLVERYLASLPGSGVRELAVDRGARPPRGVTRRTVHAGQEASGAVAITFSGQAPRSREGRSDLESLAAVLQHRLATRLRSDLGLTYDQGVETWMSPYPDASYRVLVIVPAAPERLEQVARVVLAEVDSLRANGGSEDEVLRVRQAARREFQVSRLDARFWQEQLEDANDHGWDPRKIRRPPPATTLTRERVRYAAQAYLKPGQYVQVMLLPAAGAPAAPPPQN